MGPPYRRECNHHPKDRLTVEDHCPKKQFSRLDSFGLAAFSNYFDAVDGKPASMIKILNTFEASPERPAVCAAHIFLAEVFPILEYLPWTS